jgi:hypothetical protein
MRTRVGVALSRHAIRAVAIRRNRIVWAAEVPLEPGAALPSALASLLATAPLPRFPTPVLSAVVGPHASQVRPLMGLPESSDATTASAVVRENVSSFFLKDGVPLVTTGVQSIGHNQLLAAAIDQPYVDAVRQACHARGWRLGFIAPTAVCLVPAFTDPSFAWVDGGCVVEIAYIDGTLESIRTRRVSAAESTPSSPQLTPRLATLGENASRFVDAFGVAATDTLPALALDASAAGFWTWREIRRRLLPPGILLAIGVIALVISPLSAIWAGHRAQGRLARVPEDQVQTVVSTLDVLDRTSALLEEVHAFASARPNITTLLDDLTRNLPQGSVVLSLDLTDTQWQVVVLSQSSAAVLGALGRLPKARSVELVGSVERQTFAGHEMQRITARWSEGGR